MTSVKLVQLIVVVFSVFEGCYCLNSTQNATEKTIPPVSTTSLLKKFEKTATEISNSTISWLEEIEKETIKSFTEAPANVIINSTLAKFNSANINQTKSDINDSAKTTATPTANISVLTEFLNSVNLTYTEQSWNDTLKTNYSTVAEAVGLSEETSNLKLPNWAATAAGIFLVSAALGYFSCVAYRRNLLKKYGNSQILIGEEVYDTTDLRNFEI